MEVMFGPTEADATPSDGEDYSEQEEDGGYDSENGTFSDDMKTEDRLEARVAAREAREAREARALQPVAKVCMLHYLPENPYSIIRSSLLETTRVDTFRVDTFGPRNSK